MQFAVNYSPQAAALVRAGLIQVDLFKCPAWPYCVAEAREILPTYVHFPLGVGRGQEDAIDLETGRAADWKTVDALLESTGTPFVNLHLLPPAETMDGQPEVRVDVALDRLVIDVASVAVRYGADRVILENDYEGHGAAGIAMLLPETMHSVLRETGCGLLMDLSHARLAARRLRVPACEYVEAMPVDRLREMHVSGVQPLEPTWANLLRRSGVAEDEIQRCLERLVDGLSDHLPMTTCDWELAALALLRVGEGGWRSPWAVAFEYGGIGPWFGPVTNEAILAAQVTRLREMIVDRCATGASRMAGDQ